MTPTVRPSRIALTERARITDRASLLVKTQAVVSRISFYKRFCFELGSKPRWCTFGGFGQQENLPPASKGCIMVLAKPVVLEASHRPKYDARLKAGVLIRLRQIRGLTYAESCPISERNSEGETGFWSGGNRNPERGHLPVDPKWGKFQPRATC